MTAAVSGRGAPGLRPLAPGRGLVRLSLGLALAGQRIAGSRPSRVVASGRELQVEQRENLSA